MIDKNRLELVARKYSLTSSYDSEADLLSDALDVLQILGAYVIRKDAGVLKGYPDILVCFKGRFIGIELKDKDGKLSPHQEKQITKIIAAGGKAGGCRRLIDIVTLLS